MKYAVLSIVFSLGATALDPSCAPGGNFDLTKWQLQLPYGDNGVPKTISPDNLKGCGGFQDPGHHYFFTESGDGAMVMKTPGSPDQTGCLKTSGSQHCRTEFGELAHWSPTSGTNRLFADLLVKFGTEYQVQGGQGQDLQLIGTVPVGTRFTYEVRFEGGELLARLNGDAFKTLKTYFTTPKAFFKAGNYNQDVQTTDVADLHFFQLVITH
ncbi:hypothetical protein ACLMJK_007040 [Lecanora helva]